MISYDFGMHRAGVFLHLPALLLLDLVLAMGVLCDHRVSNRQRKCARDYGCNLFSAFRLVVGQAPGLPCGRITATAAVALQTARDCDCSTPRKGGACARRLCCKINSANENAPGGPVSSNSGATARDEYTTNAPARTGKFASQNFASLRAQSFVFAKTTARRILQHCTCEDCSFCFAGLEWNGHSVCALSISVATAANAQ